MQVTSNSFKVFNFFKDFKEGLGRNQRTLIGWWDGKTNMVIENANKERKPRYRKGTCSSDQVVALTCSSQFPFAPFFSEAFEKCLQF